jgi:hypothetical protein
MEIKRFTAEPFSATITIGSQITYSDQKISEDEIIKFIQEHQDKLIEEKNLYLSVCLSHCSIILSGQVEPHCKLSFINYPRFPLNKDVLKTEVEGFAKVLMFRFDQNRIVIEFSDETIMFEQTDKIDPRIID